MNEPHNIVLTYNFAHGLLKSHFDIELARPLGKGELWGHIHRQCNHTEETKRIGTVVASKSRQGNHTLLLLPHAKYVYLHRLVPTDPGLLPTVFKCFQFFQTGSDLELDSGKAWE